MLCEQYLRRAHDSLKGVLNSTQENLGQPEGLGRPGVETWQGCEEPLPNFHDCLREGAGLFWVAPWGSTTSVGRGYWWTDQAQV